LRSRLRLNYGGRSSRSRLDLRSRLRLDYGDRSSRSRLDLRSRLRFGVEVKVEA
jgi:hypothetical protein